MPCNTMLWGVQQISLYPAETRVIKCRQWCPVLFPEIPSPVSLYHLLADCAAVEYLWDCLLDAMAEFHGAPVGLTALRRLGGG